MTKFLLMISAGRTMIAIVLLSAPPLSEAQKPGGARTETFTNPLLSVGPDPWVIFHEGYYYYMNTTARNLTIWKTPDITDLRDAEKRIVWTPPPAGPDSHEIWAPELHFLDGKWYIYFAADYGKNETHRLFVLENASPDPLDGRFAFKAELATGTWAIDPSVFDNGGERYIVWSGWPGDVNGTQNIYIARLKNPWTIDGRPVMISTPTDVWETYGALAGQNPAKVLVNEGPEILKHNGAIFLIYSGSGCWTDTYALGMLTASADSDLLRPASWNKVHHAVFSQAPAAHAFGTGHNAFFKSPDGKEDWIIYHANPDSGEGCGNRRSPRAQPFTWNADGTPNFGVPVPLETPIPKPSGTAHPF